MFQVKITRARFTYSPFSSEQMVRIGDAFVAAAKKRIQSGLDVNDAAAKPVVPGYANWKRRRGLQPLRDWTVRGRTLGSMKVKSANENRVVIGFVDDQADLIAHVQNLRCKMFGISPRDKAAIDAAVRAELARVPMVELKRVA